MANEVGKCCDIKFCLDCEDDVAICKECHSEYNLAENNTNCCKT